MSFAPAELTARLEADAAYFDEKLAFIPTRYYLAGESDQQAFEKKGKNKNKKKKKKTKNKASSLNKFRVDQKTLPEKIDEGRFGTGITEGDVEHQFVEAPAAVKKKRSISSVGEQDDAPMIPPVGKHMNAQMSEIAEKLGFVPGSQAKSPAELKQRMALLRDWYKSKNSRPEGDDVAESEKKKARKLQKQKRKEKMKTKKKKEKSGEDGAESGAASAVAADGSAPASTATTTAATDKPVALDYGVFKFNAGKSEPLFRERKRGRDQDVLKKLEAEKQKMEELAKTPEGAQLVKDKEWEKMIMRAEGEKVKDDPTLLKKTIKKKEKKKQKSQADWASKAKKQEEAKQAKQADYLKRQEKNILRKKHGRKQVGASSGGDASTRKGRAGFEGRVQKKANK